MIIGAGCVQEGGGRKWMVRIPQAVYHHMMSKGKPIVLRVGGEPCEVVVS